MAENERLRDALAEAVWRALDEDGPAQGVTWETNYARTAWYAAADAVLGVVNKATDLCVYCKHVAARERA